MPSEKPVIFLAFANDRAQAGNYLRNLGHEAETLRGALAPAEQAGLCQVETLTSASAESILKRFHDPAHRGRIALFHYAGHAEDYDLLLESATGEPVMADGRGLALFLRQQTGLHLVFLNACSTRVQVEGLLDAGVAAVIATSRAIDDELAAGFATAFYQSLAGGDTLTSAFDKAKASVQFSHGDLSRHLRPRYQPGQEHTAQGLPWELYTRPGATLALAWSLPAAAGKPLWNLPPLPAMDLPPEPFRDLSWFRRADAAIFFGRGQQIRQLYTTVTDAGAMPIVLFYGQSGVGKSSLLDAGLLPRLEQVQRVVYLRREREKGLLGTLLAHISGFSAPAAGKGSPNVGEAWRAIEKQANQPLTLILDQVEEHFTRPNPEIPNEMEQFLRALTAIFADRGQRPQGKLILSFRKEWLAEIEKRLGEYELPFKKVFLERLDKAGVIEAISGVARTPALQDYGLTIAEGLVEEIANDLLKDREAPVALMLQILLTRLWEEARQCNRAKPCFDRTLYDQLRRDGLKLKEFLDRQLARLKEQQPGVVDSGLALDLLRFHTTPLGTAEQRDLVTLQAEYRHRAAILTDLVRSLQNLYLLVDPAADQADTLQKSRLAHDTLAPLVQARFDESDLPGQRAWRILRSRISSFENLTDNEEAPPLDETDLKLVENGQFGMRSWTAPERKLVEKSKQARYERQKREKWVRNLKRLAIGSTVLLLIVSLVAWVWTTSAMRETQINETKQIAANAQNRLLKSPADNMKPLIQVLKEMPNNRQYTPFFEFWGRRLVKNLADYIFTKRPYVPAIEFAFTEALQRNLERKRIHVSETAKEKVAFSKDWIAVAKAEQTELIKLPLQLPPWLNESRSILQKLQNSAPLSISVPIAHVTHLGFAPNQDLLAYDDNNVYILRNENNNWHQWRQRSLGNENGVFQCVSWQPDSKAVAFCSDGALWLWKLEEDELDKIVTTNGPFWATDWSPDGRYLLVINSTPTPVIYSIESKQLVQLVGHKEQVAGGKFVSVERIVTWSIEDSDKSIRLWSPLGEQLAVIPIDRSIVDVEISEKGGQFIAYDVEGSADIWELTDSGRTLTPSRSLLSTAAKIQDAAWQDNFIALVDVNGSIHIWNTQNGELLVTLHGHEQEPINRVEWQPDKLHLLTHGQDGTVRVWRIFAAPGKPICQSQPNDDELNCRTLLAAEVAHPEPIRSVAWNGQGEALFFDRTGALYTWAPENGYQAELAAPSIYPDQQIIWNDGKSNALIYEQAGNGEIWTYDHHRWRKTVELPVKINRAMWNENLLVTISNQEQIDLWNIDPQNSSSRAIPFQAEVMSLALYRNEQDEKLAVGQKGDVTIWDIGSTQPILLDELHTNAKDALVVDIQWSKTGKQMLGKQLGDRVVLWDIDKNQPNWEYADKDQDQQGGATPQFSPDEQQIAFTIGSDLYILNAKNGKSILKDSTHLDKIVGIKWNQDGTRLVTWANDQIVRLWSWDGSILSEILRLHIGCKPKAAAFNDDETEILIGSECENGVGQLSRWKTWGNIKTLVEDANTHFDQNE